MCVTSKSTLAPSLNISDSCSMVNLSEVGSHLHMSGHCCAIQVVAMRQTTPHVSARQPVS